MTVKAASFSFDFGSIPLSKGPFVARPTTSLEHDPVSKRQHRSGLKPVNRQPYIDYSTHNILTIDERLHYIIVTCKRILSHI